MSFEELMELPHPCNGCEDKVDGCKVKCFDLFTYRNAYKKYNEANKVAPTTFFKEKDHKQVKARFCKQVRAGKDLNKPIKTF